MNSIYKLVLVAFLLLNLSWIKGQEIPAYYNGINFNLNGEALKDELSDLIIDTHDYTVSYDQLWDILQHTDLYPLNNQKVNLLYGWDDTNTEDDDDFTRDKYATCGNGNDCTDETWNREHVFPMALDESDSENSGPTADPHMLRACDVEMNGRRANKEYGLGTGVASYITSNGDFYPGSNWKGDVARIIMYMYLRYGEQWNPNLVGNDSNTFHQDMPDLFLEWNEEDPVSEYEMQRNNYVYGVQGNRNPFIDNPYLATKIWGGPAADDSWGTLSIHDVELTKIQVYPNPTSNYIEFKGLPEDANIFITNVLGQILPLDLRRNQIYLPSQGIYFINIQFNDQKQVFKVIRK